MVSGIFAASLKLGRGLRASEILITVTARYNKESTSLGPAAAGTAGAACTTSATLLGHHRLTTLERVPADLGSRLTFWWTGNLHTGKEPYVARVSMRYSWNNSTIN